MGLIIGPFNVPLFAPLGPSPRDNLLGADLLGNQFPDGISVPFLACYYPNGRTVTCALWQLQAYIFPFWDYPRGYQVNYSTPGLEKLAIVVGSLVAFARSFGAMGLRLALSIWSLSRHTHKNTEICAAKASEYICENQQKTRASKLRHNCCVFDFKCNLWFLRYFWH